MENDDKLLANEYIRGFLKRELNKPLKILESRFNEYETQNKERFKQLEQKVSDIHDKQLLIEQNFDIHKMDKSSMNKEILKIKEELSNSVKKEEFEIFMTISSVAVKKLQDEINKNLLSMESFKAIHSNYLINMTENVNINDVNLVDLGNRFGEYELERDEFYKAFKFSKEQELKYKDDFNTKADGVFMSIDLKIKDQEDLIALIDKTIKNSCNVMKRDSTKLSQEIEDKFDKFSSESSSDLQTAKRRIKESQERIDNLKEEIIVCKKGGKIDKEVDDFMKQVGYNAKQIAKIQKMLEAM